MTLFSISLSKLNTFEEAGALSTSRQLGTVSVKQVAITEKDKLHTPEPNRTELRPVLLMMGLIGLVLTVLPTFVQHYVRIGHSTSKRMVFVGVVLWAVSALFWNKKALDQEDLLA